MFQLTPVRTIPILRASDCGAMTTVTPAEPIGLWSDAKKGAVTESIDAGWSSLVARRAHNPKVVGSNPAPATNLTAARCSLTVTSEAPFGAFLWPLNNEA